MLKVRNGNQIVNINIAKSYEVGDGPYAISLTGAAPPPAGDKILLEGSLVDFLMLENGTDYLLQE